MKRQPGHFQSVATLKKHLWREGTERGECMVAFLKSHLTPPLAGMDILEIGGGGGGIGVAFAQHARRVVTGDISFGTLRLISERIDYTASPFDLANFDALSLPFVSQSFHIVLLNGVLEYTGCRPGPSSPIDYQRKVLEEILRVLKPGGTLYLGIENRWYLRNLLCDPHTRQPLVCMLPRGLADWYSRVTQGTSYRHWIHSLNGLKKLLKTAGYGKTQVFVPITSYQFPREYVDINCTFQFIKCLRRENMQVSTDFTSVTRLSWASQLWQTIMAILGVTSLVAGGFVIVAQEEN